MLILIQFDHPNILVIQYVESLKMFLFPRYPSLTLQLVCSLRRMLTEVNPNQTPAKKTYHPEVLNKWRLPTEPLVGHFRLTFRLTKWLLRLPRVRTELATILGASHSVVTSHVTPSSMWVEGELLPSACRRDPKEGCPFRVVFQGTGNTGLSTGQVFPSTITTLVDQYNFTD